MIVESTSVTLTPEEAQLLITAGVASRAKGIMDALAELEWVMEVGTATIIPEDIGVFLEFQRYLPELR